MALSAQFEAAPAAQRDFALVCLSSPALLPPLSALLRVASGGYVDPSAVAVASSATTALLDFTVAEYNAADDSVSIKLADEIRGTVTQEAVSGLVAEALRSHVYNAEAWIDAGPFIPLPPPPPSPPPSPRPPLAPLPPAAPAERQGCDLLPCFPGVVWCASLLRACSVNERRCHEKQCGPKAC